MDKHGKIERQTMFRAPQEHESSLLFQHYQEQTLEINKNNFVTVNLSSAL